MTTSPPTRKILTSSLSKSLLIVTHKVGGIVKVLDVIPSIPFQPVSSPTNEILHCAALTFLYCSLVKQTVYFKEFGGVGVTVDKHGR